MGYSPWGCRFQHGWARTPPHPHTHLNETPCRWVCCAELGRRDRSHQDHEVGAFFLKELGRCSSKHPCTPLCQPLPLSDPFLLQESSSWGNIYSLYSLLPLSFFSSLNHTSKCQGSGKEPLPSLPLQCYRTTSTYLRRSRESPRHFPERVWPILFIKAVTKGILYCIQYKCW